MKQEVSESGDEEKRPDFQPEPGALPPTLCFSRAMAPGALGELWASFTQLLGPNRGRWPFNPLGISNAALQLEDLTDARGGGGEGAKRASTVVPANVS